ncbi:MAG: hypothetical protein ACP5RV_13045, partial [Thiomonas sp.]
LRLQSLSRLDDADVFAFLQTHPLTSERIADAQARAGDKPLPPDHSLQFWLMNARARALTPQSHDALLREAHWFANAPADFPAQQAAWAYGQAVVLQRLNKPDAAAAALARAQAAARNAPAAERLPLDLLQTELLLATPLGPAWVKLGAAVVAAGYFLARRGILGTILSGMLAYWALSWISRIW